MPVWLRELKNNDGSNITFRSTDSSWIDAVTRFAAKVLEVMRSENLLYIGDSEADIDGPIVLLQIENEYGNIQHNYPGLTGMDYVNEIANYAASKKDLVPWIMCQQGEGVGTGGEGRETEPEDPPGMPPVIVSGPPS